MYENLDMSAYQTAYQASPLALIVSLGISILLIASMWKLLKKAGLPGWGAIVPIYNLYLLFKMSFGNGWLFLVLLIPIANLIIGIMLSFKLAKAFGKGTGFGFGLLFLSFIFEPILAFGDSKYVGIAK